MRFGDINRIVEEPCLYFKMPFADTVTRIDDRIIPLGKPTTARCRTRKPGLYR